MSEKIEPCAWCKRKPITWGIDQVRHICHASGEKLDLRASRPIWNEVMRAVRMMDKAKSNIDEMINYWREEYKDEDAARRDRALYYLDALQSVRQNIFGELLPKHQPKDNGAGGEAKPNPKVVAPHFPQLTHGTDS